MRALYGDGVLPPVDTVLFDKPYDQLTKKERDKVEYYRRELRRFQHKQERGDLYDKQGRLIPNMEDLDKAAASNKIVSG